MIAILSMPSFWSPMNSPEPGAKFVGPRYAGPHLWPHSRRDGRESAPHLHRGTSFPQSSPFPDMCFFLGLHPSPAPREAAQAPAQVPELHCSSGSSDYAVGLIVSECLCLGVLFVQVQARVGVKCQLQDFLSPKQISFLDNSRSV